MVRPARIELAALRLGGVRSIQLSYEHEPVSLNHTPAYVKTIRHNTFFCYLASPVTGPSEFGRMTLRLPRLPAARQTKNAQGKGSPLNPADQP